MSTGSAASGGVPLAGRDAAMARNNTNLDYGVSSNTCGLLQDAKIRRDTLELDPGILSLHQKD